MKQVVREWCPSTTGPLLPTMTDSVFVLGRVVLYERYHGGELLEVTILGPSMEEGPVRGEHVQLFCMKREPNKGFYSEKC